jgi:hypothetical protein
MCMGMFKIPKPPEIEAPPLPPTPPPPPPPEQSKPVESGASQKEGKSKNDLSSLMIRTASAQTSSMQGLPTITGSGLSTPL